MRVWSLLLVAAAVFVHPAGAVALESVPTVSEIKSSADPTLANKLCAAVACIHNEAVRSSAEAAKGGWHIGDPGDFVACAWANGLPSIGVGPAADDPTGKQLANEVRKAVGGGVITSGGLPVYTFFHTSTICSPNEFFAKAVVFEEAYHETEGPPTHTKPGNSKTETDVSQLDLDALLRLANSSYAEIQAKLAGLEENDQHAGGGHEVKRVAARKDLLVTLQEALTEFCKYFDRAEALIDAGGGDENLDAEQKRTMIVFRKCKAAAEEELK